jgi:small conductance mechanosensitive channel
MLGLGRFRRARSAFESRTEEWRQVGLGSELDRQGAQRARGRFVVLLGLIAAVLVVFDHRGSLFPGLGTPVRVVTVVALAVLGWALAQSLGRGIAPALFRRMDPATAGTVGFLIRLTTIAVVIALALRIAGLRSGTLALGGAVTAVVLALAAQQTLGNLFAGLVLLSTRPFRVGDRVRLVGGALAGQLEGIVSSLGLFYATLVSGADRILVPNAVVLNLAVVPLREPERVELRARFSADTTPSEVQERLEGAISVPTRYAPHIELEELDRDEVVVRIVATPTRPTDGAKLAGEILAAVRQTDGATSRATDGRQRRRVGLARQQHEEQRDDDQARLDRRQEPRRSGQRVAREAPAGAREDPGNDDGERDRPPERHHSIPARVAFRLARPQPALDRERRREQGGEQPRREQHDPAVDPVGAQVGRPRNGREDQRPGPDQRSREDDERSYPEPARLTGCDRRPPCGPPGGARARRRATSCAARRSSR